LDIARAIPAEDPATFIAALLKQIATLDPRNLTEDDVTVLLFRHSSRTNDAGLIERAGAMLRMVYGLRPGAPDHPWPELSLANIGGALLKPLNRFWRGSRPAPIERTSR